MRKRYVLDLLLVCSKMIRKPLPTCRYCTWRECAEVILLLPILRFASNRSIEKSNGFVQYRVNIILSHAVIKLKKKKEHGARRPGQPHVRVVTPKSGRYVFARLQPNVFAVKLRLTNAQVGHRLSFFNTYFVGVTMFLKKLRWKLSFKNYESRYWVQWLIHRSWAKLKMIFLTKKKPCFCSTISTQNWKLNFFS